MSSVFINQTYLQIILSSGINMVGAKETSIYYRKPSGIIGHLDAEVTDAASGILKYECFTGDTFLNEPGEWRFWNRVVFSDERIARGESLCVTIGNDQQ